MKMTVTKGAFVLFTFLLLVGGVVATDEYGDLKLTVRDTISGKPIEQAVVTFEKDGEVWEETTNDNGVLNYDDLEVGEYDITVSAPGYKEVVHEQKILVNYEVKEEYALSPDIDVEEDVPEYLDDGNVHFFVYDEDVYSNDYEYTNLEDHGLAGSRIYIYNEGWSYYSWYAVTDSRGHAYINLPSGNYEYEVDGPAGENWDVQSSKLHVFDHKYDAEHYVEVGIDRDNKVVVYREDGYDDLYYITVIGENSATSDVVNAANYAAYMKSATGKTFTGMLTSELEDHLQTMTYWEQAEYLDHAFMVRFAGNKFAIYQESGKFDTVASTTKAYLNAEGLAWFGASMSGEPLLERWFLSDLDTDGFPIETIVAESTHDHMMDDASDTILVDTETNVDCDNSCAFESKCIPYGLRAKNGKPLYCDIISGTMMAQQEEGSACQNDFECLSNSCSNGACIDLQKELQEQRGIIQGILDWLKAIF